MRKRRSNKVLSQPVARSEVKALFAAAQSLRERAMLRVLYETGVRVGELVDLNGNDIDAGWLRVRREKTDGDLRSDPPLAKETEALLRQLARGDGPLFRNSHGGRLTAAGARFLLRAIAARSGLRTRFHPHRMRTSCATHGMQDGTPLPVMQALLGHANPGTTSRYMHVSGDDLRLAVEKLRRGVR